MGIAEQLGLGDRGSVPLDAARAAWRGWCAGDPVLAVVQELDELRGWTRGASSEAKRVVVKRLAEMTADDEDAVTALAWLMIPGAAGIAAKLRDLHPDIDGLVAGQFWIEVACAHRLTTSNVAGAILARTRREVAAELGIGDLAMRRDRVWAGVALVENLGELVPSDDGHESGDGLWDWVNELTIAAIQANAIHVFDAWLLTTLADLAARRGVPGHRGRMGMTTPAVIEELADIVHLSPRALRRRAATAIDRFAEFLEAAKSRERFAVWRAQHTSCPVTPAEEMQLVLSDDHDAEFFRFQDLPPGAWAPDVLPRRRRPETA